jgi:hypothetical protein
MPQKAARDPDGPRMSLPGRMVSPLSAPALRDHASDLQIQVCDSHMKVSDLSASGGLVQKSGIKLWIGHKVVAKGEEKR